MRTNQKKRNDRIRKRAMQLYESAQLPPRMHMWNKIEEGEQEKEQENKLRPTYFDMPFKPKINTKVPNFIKLHQQFNKSLKKVKAERKKTKVNPFNFHNTIHSIEMDNVLNEMKQDTKISNAFQSPISFSKTESKEKNKSKKIKSNRPTSASPKVSPTKTTKLREEAIQKKIQERELKKKKKQNEMYKIERRIYERESKLRQKKPK
jgi:hypothetical protein